MDASAVYYVKAPRALVQRRRRVMAIYLGLDSLAALDAYENKMLALMPAPDGTPEGWRMMDRFSAAQDAAGCPNL